MGIQHGQGAGLHEKRYVKLSLPGLDGHVKQMLHQISLTRDAESHDAHCFCRYGKANNVITQLTSVARPPSTPVSSESTNSSYHPSSRTRLVSPSPKVLTPTQLLPSREMKVPSTSPLPSETGPSGNGKLSTPPVLSAPSTRPSTASGRTLTPTIKRTLSNPRQLGLLKSPVETTGLR